MDKKKLIDDLNDDLAGELGAIIQYITYSAKVNGPYRPELKAFFMGEVPDETGHAEFLANKIVALGGTPTTVARPTAPADHNKDMLEQALKAERRAIDDYTRRVAEAEEYGDKGLQVRLEDIVLDETGHYEETERMLREWPL
jgi:bacterioferritin